MRKILKAAWIVISCIVAAVYFLSCLTPFISPQKISFFSLLAIAFPYICIAALLCSVIFLFFYKRIAIAAILLVFIAGFKNLHNTVALRTPRWQMHKADSTLRVMTWNVEGFVHLLAENDPHAQTRLDMLAAINRYKPDVLCVQELISVDNGIRRLSIRKELDSLGYAYSFISNDTVIEHASNHGTIITSKGVAFFARQPFIDSGRVNIIGGDRPENMIYADINFYNRPVRVFTAHLRSYDLYMDTANKDENIYKITYQRNRSALYKIRRVEAAHAAEVAIISSAII